MHCFSPTSASGAESGISAIQFPDGKSYDGGGLRAVISFFHMEVLEQIEARIVEHHSAGRSIQWLGGGADALGLAALDREEAIAAVFSPTSDLKRNGGRAGGTIAGMSLLFSPPFEVAHVRESKKASEIRAAHIAAARVALRHLESWTMVRDVAGGTMRPSGLVYALCVADDAFILDMMVLGWGIGPGMRWGLVDGWTLAAKLGTAEDIYASEIEDRLASQGLKLTWTGPSNAELKAMVWRERRARWALAQYGRKNFWQVEAT